MSYGAELGLFLNGRPKDEELERERSGVMMDSLFGLIRHSRSAGPLRWASSAEPRGRELRHGRIRSGHSKGIFWGSLCGV